MWQQIFGLTNLIALIAWLVLILAPRRPVLLSLVMFAGVGLFA